MELTCPLIPTPERVMSITHPIPVGATVVSVLGEWNKGEDGTKRETGPNAVGKITSADFCDDQGWFYHVDFSPSDVWIILDEGDPLNNPNRYVIQLKQDRDPYEYDLYLYDDGCTPFDGLDQFANDDDE